MHMSQNVWSSHLNVTNTFHDTLPLIVAFWRDMASDISVFTGSINGLLPDGLKKLPEAILTYRRRVPLALISG